MKEIIISTFVVTTGVTLSYSFSQKKDESVISFLYKKASKNTLINLDQLHTDSSEEDKQELGYSNTFGVFVNNNIFCEKCVSRAYLLASCDAVSTKSYLSTTCRF